MPAHADAPARPRLPRPVAQLFGDLTREAADLVHAELGEKIDRARSGLQALAAAGLVGAAGLVMVLLALSRLVAGLLPPALAAWLAPLLLGAVALLAGGWLYARGRRALDPQQLAPRHTIDTLGDDRRAGPHRQAGDPAQATEGQDPAAELFERHPLLIGGLGVVLGGVRSALQAHMPPHPSAMLDPRDALSADPLHAAVHWVHAGVDEAEEVVKGMTEIASDAAERLLYGDGATDTGEQWRRSH